MDAPLSSTISCLCIDDGKMDMRDANVPERDRGKSVYQQLEHECLPLTLVHGKRRTTVITGSANLRLTASKHQLLCAKRVLLARVLPPIRPEYPIRNTLVSHLYGKPYSFMVFNQTKATDLALKAQ